VLVKRREAGDQVLKGVPSVRQTKQNYSGRRTCSDPRIKGGGRANAPPLKTIDPNPWGEDLSTLSTVVDKSRTILVVCGGR